MAPGYFIVLLGELGDLDVICYQSAQIRERMRESGGQSCVVKLAVKIRDSTPEVALLDGRQLLDRLRGT